MTQRLFDWYSQKSAGLAAGFSGADLLTRFRLEVDIPSQRTWWQPGPKHSVRDLDIIGISVSAENDGSFSVAGVVKKDGQPAVAGIEPGDRILAVDNLDAAYTTMGKLVDALRGKPGAVRALKLQREGKPFTITATVVHLP